MMKIAKHVNKSLTIFKNRQKNAKKRTKLVMFLKYSQCLLRNQTQDVATTTTTRARATTT